jgi:small subunit ribosomal protein S17
MAERKSKKTADETLEQDATEQTESVESQDEQAVKADAPETDSQADQATEEQPSIVESVMETVSSAASSVAETATNVVSGVAKAVGLTATESSKRTRGSRAEKIGVVSSDKMTKTVVVNVDRQVLHPKYRRYIRKTSKFMAHDETGATIGDKVRIVETRPLSARKRWRVIEIVQKAAK